MKKKRNFVLAILGLLVIENAAFSILFLCGTIAWIILHHNPITAVIAMLLFFALTGFSIFAFIYVLKNDFSISKEEREKLANEKRERRIQAKREKLQAKLEELKE
ncbi:MAG: hypothetical protein K2H30_02480 [Clostridia bacterium]|nr:hypothetical protein [Clostridia bacterium]